MCYVDKFKKKEHKDIIYMFGFIQRTKNRNNLKILFLGNRIVGGKEWRRKP